MYRTLLSLLVAALISLAAFAADAKKVVLSTRTYATPTTAALNNAAYLMMSAANAKQPGPAGRQLGFVQGADYLKLGPITWSRYGRIMRIVVQTRRSATGKRGGAPYAEVKMSVLPIKNKAGEIVSWRAYNRANPENKIRINR